MRVRFAVLFAVLLFSLASPATADASWSAFVAWLSSLDPHSGGGGIEARFPDTSQPVTFKASAAILFGKLEGGGGTIAVFPALGSVERNVNNHFSFGGGAGVIVVGGTRVGTVTRSLLQGQATFKFANARFGVRPEVNVIPKGFPAGAFEAGAPATGTEVVPGASFVFFFK